MHRKTLTTVIIKSMPKSHMTETTKERLQSEADFLKLAAANSVPHLVRLIEKIEDDTHVYIVLEQAPGEWVASRWEGSGFKGLLCMRCSATPSRCAVALSPPT
jgi:hypothetical protein